MKNRAIFILTCLFLIFPLIYFYYVLFPPNIISVENALSSFSKNFIREVKKKKLRGYISSVEKIDGITDGSVQKLVPVFNLILSNYSGWKVLITENERKEIKDRINLYMKRWGGIVGYDSLYKFIKKEANAIRRLKYYPQVKCEFIPGEKKLILLNFSIVDFGAKSNILTISTRFTHPLYYEKIKKRERIIKYGTYISILLIIFMYLSYLLIYLYQRISLSIKRRKIKKTFPEIMERLENYFNKGHFVAADNLINQCLKVLPENTDLIAFKERLEDYCGGDPKRAQIAYVEMLKLKKRISVSNEGEIPALEHQEREKVKELIPYCPELKTLYEEYSKLASEKIIKREIGLVLSLLREGRLKQAREEADKLLHQYPSNKDIINLLERIEEQDKEAKNYLKEAKEEFNKMNVENALKLLEESLKLNQELEEADEMKYRIIKAKEIKKIMLKPEKIGKEIIILNQETVTFGRENTDIVISHPQISRKHLKISMVDDKVIAEDLNSTNGTFHRGNRIDKLAEIVDGDILNLAGVYQLIIHIIYSNRGQVSQLTQQAEITLQNFAEPNNTKKGVSGIYIEASDRDYIILRNSVPLDLKPIGISFEKISKYQLVNREGIIFLSTSQKAYFLYPGEKIQEKGLIYTVKKYG